MSKLCLVGNYQTCNENTPAIDSQNCLKTNRYITISVRTKIYYFNASKTALKLKPVFVHNYNLIYRPKYDAASVTRLGDLLDFGQLFKAFGNNQFAQISHILRQLF